MPGVAKAGVDWASIEIGYRGGEKIAHMAARHGISRAAIQQRARRHGWKVTADAEALTSTATAERLREPETRADRRIIANGQRTLANMQMVLDLLSEGASVRLAAQRIGMAPNALRNWMESDQDFARMAAAAEAEAGLRSLERVGAAGARGEWKADAWMLERLRATREDFAPVPAGVPNGPGIPILQMVLSREMAERLSSRVYAEDASPLKIMYRDDAGDLVEVKGTRRLADKPPIIDQEPEAEAHG